MSITKLESHRIGIDIWWDHKLKKYRKKRLDLKKIPSKFRCPNCGNVLGRRTHQRDVRMGQIELMFMGGVCRKCMMNGFGKSGWLGLIVTKENKEREEQQKKFEGFNEVWINGKLHWAKQLIEVKT